jgi:dienelactone hydrolase
MTCFVRISVAALFVFFGCWFGAFAQTIEEIVEPTLVAGERAVPLAGTAKLEMTGDVASQLVDGVDKFLLRKLAESPAGREKYWKRDFSSPEAYAKSVEPNRARLAKMIGLRDERTKTPRIEVISPPGKPVEFAQNEYVSAYTIRWHVFDQVHGEGILLTPRNGTVRGRVVAIPHCDQVPEDIAGVSEDPFADAWALWLAHQGFMVAIPHLIGREPTARNDRAVMSDREFVYRSSFELGRHPLGHDVAKVLSLLDAWRAQRPEAKIGVAGHGEGGFIALLSGAIDTRIDATLVSGFFGPAEVPVKVPLNISNDGTTVSMTGKSVGSWEGPIDRNLFGFLREFGCAEVASLIAPRRLVVSTTNLADSTTNRFKPGRGGAPFDLVSAGPYSARKEIRRATDLIAPLKLEVISSGPRLVGSILLHPETGEPHITETGVSKPQLVDFANHFEIAVKAYSAPARLIQKRESESIKTRLSRNIEELIAHNSHVLTESPFTRKEFFKALKTDSLDNFKQTIEPYRKHFEEETIGKFDDSMLALNPRTRLAYETDKWKGYEVVLDVFPDVIAYGILILPKDLKEGEKRPVVICQHGLEGRPQDLIGKKGFDAYKAFAGRLAERGFITFAPQNLYIFQDRFRTLQRKANPLGKTLFSIIVPQHRQIVKWLSEQNFVDKERIAFYGLSYGGKSAMRIPPLVPEYCLSICSADFNEWVWKNASTTSPYSYVWTNEYEIFEWDLGSTFNYAEMAALIAPRPFMVERGHFDGVAPDETVAYEFAKVKHLYHAQLKLPEDHCRIEFFVGPHTINGKGTFEFLHHHLKWPGPDERNR